MCVTAVTSAFSATLTTRLCIALDDILFCCFCCCCRFFFFLCQLHFTFCFRIEFIHFSLSSYSLCVLRLREYGMVFVSHSMLLIRCANANNRDAIQWFNVYLSQPIFHLYFILLHCIAFFTIFRLLWTHFVWCNFHQSIDRFDFEFEFDSICV